MAPAPKEYVLTDIQMPFWRMVVVIFKSTLAAIPAAFLVGLVILLFQVGGTALLLWGGSFLGGGGTP